MLEEERDDLGMLVGNEHRRVHGVLVFVHVRAVIEQPERDGLVARFRRDGEHAVERHAFV